MCGFCEVCVKTRADIQFLISWKAYQKSSERYDFLYSFKMCFRLFSTLFYSTAMNSFIAFCSHNWSNNRFSLFSACVISEYFFGFHILIEPAIVSKRKLRSMIKFNAGWVEFPTVSVTLLDNGRISKNSLFLYRISDEFKIPEGNFSQFMRAKESFQMTDVSC